MTATRIDPDELLPSNPEGKAASVPEFHDVVIAAINDHADQIELRVVEVTDYGATGDGASDDTAALQRALDDSQGKVLNLRKGKYKVSSTLIITTTCHRIVGALAARAIDGGTEIMYTGTGPLFQIGTDNGHPWDADDYDGPQDQWFENIWLSHGAPDTNLDMGGAIGAYKAGSHAIRDWRGGGIRLRSVGIEHFEYSFWGVQSDINEFDDVISLYSHYGIYAGPRSDQFTIRNLYTFFCDQALTIDGEVNGLRLVDAQIVGCGTATRCAVDIATGASGIRITRPWLEHFQGYTGTDQAGFIAAGITVGYGTNTNSAKRITVDQPIVLTNGVGIANHTRCIVQLGKAYDVRIDRPASPAGISDGLNVDAFVIAPSGTNYDNAHAFAEVTGIDSGFALTSLFLNEGTGTPGFSYIADSGNGGITLYSPYLITAKGPLSATSTLGVTGTATFQGNIIAQLQAFFGSANQTYISNDEINFYYQTNGSATGFINYHGYQAGATQPRDLSIRDGQTNEIAKFGALGKTFSVVGLATLSGGVVTKTKAGAPTDADFINPVDGLIAVDTTNSKIYVRIGGAWKSVTLT